MWNVAAIYGAALRGHTKAAAGDQAAATQLLGARAQEREDHGQGRPRVDGHLRAAASATRSITYENEILVGKQARARTTTTSIPQSTILIENPVAVVDTLRRQARHAASWPTRSSRSWRTPEAQRAFAEVRAAPGAARGRDRGRAELPDGDRPVHDPRPRRLGGACRRRSSARAPPTTARWPSAQGARQVSEARRLRARARPRDSAPIAGAVALYVGAARGGAARARWCTPASPTGLDGARGDAVSAPVARAALWLTVWTAAVIARAQRAARHGHRLGARALPLPGPHRARRRWSICRSRSRRSSPA